MPPHSRFLFREILDHLCQGVLFGEDLHVVVVKAEHFHRPILRGIIEFAVCINDGVIVAFHDDRLLRLVTEDQIVLRSRRKRFCKKTVHSCLTFGKLADCAAFRQE